MRTSDDKAPACAEAASTSDSEAEHLAETEDALVANSHAPLVDRGDPKKRAGAAAVAALVTALAMGFTSFAFVRANAGQALFYMVMASGYGVLSLAAIVWLRRHNQLKTLLPRRGDIFLGSIAAGTLYMVASAVSVGLLAPGTVRHSWLVGIYLHLGDPRVAMPVFVGFAVLMIAAAEELVWRGWVMRALAGGFGQRRGWLISTALYAIAHAATLYLLRIPNGGLNPLLVAAALGCGLVWGAMATRLERTAPSIFCHAVFSWALIRFPLFG